MPTDGASGAGRFVLDGDDVVFNTGAATVKGRNLARDGRVALCVDDDRPPFAYVILKGRARRRRTPGSCGTGPPGSGGRYVGEDRAEEFGARNGVPGELLVRVRIDKVLAEKGVADPHRAGS